MSGDLMSEKLDYTQLIDFDEHDLSQTDLSILQSRDFDFTLNETKNDPLKTYSEKVQPGLVNFSSTNTSQYQENTSDGGKFNCEKLYYNTIKPLCTDLENSYGELFSNTKVKGPDFFKAFVEKRVAKALEKVKKSMSCSNLNNVDTSTPFTNNGVDGAISSFRKSLTSHNDTYNINNANTSKVVNEVNHPPFVFRSNEALNYSHCSDEAIANFKPLNSTYDTHTAQPNAKLRKSLSFSGYSGINKNESLLDIEMQLDDFIPSDDEKDELGLPIKKIFIDRTPTKKADLSRTLKKYKKILRASFGGEQCEDGNVNENLRESEGVPAAISNNAEAEPEPPLLPEIQDYEIHLKKGSNKVTTKGPMKALVPLQNMTKQMGVKIMSPFKKKKEKAVDVSMKNSSQVLVEGSDVGMPMASSTPTSDGRSSRSSSTNNSVHTSRRSLSAGGTPTKKEKETTQTVLHTGKATTLQGQQRIHKSTDSSTGRNSGKGSDQLVNSKRKVASICVRRPATAPVNIKAPLMTKLFTVNQTSANRIKSSSNISTAITKSNNTNKTSTSKLSVNSTRTLRSADIKETKTTAQSKFRRPSSYIGKENK